MFNPVSLIKIAEELNWESWDEIKLRASNIAGFIFPSKEEKELLQKNFKSEIGMSIENINLHSRLTVDSRDFFGHVSLFQEGKKHKFKVIDNTGKIQKPSVTAKIKIHFNCPDCKAEYSFYLAVKNFMKDSPFCKKCCKSVLHKCKSYIAKYENSMIQSHGVSRPLKSEKIKLKTRNTMIEKYGVEFSIHSKEIEEKRKITLIRKYGKDNVWRGINPHVEYQIKGSGITVSRGEKEMVDFLDEKIFFGYNTKSHKNSQQRFQSEDIIGFFDYYVPDLKLAIEFHGDYFHANPDFFSDDYEIRQGLSAADVRRRNEIRIKAAENLGIKVFIVWENKWESCKQEVLKEIRSFLDDHCKNS